MVYFYDLKVNIFLSQFFRLFLHIRSAEEHKFADEKQKGKKPVSCPLKLTDNEKIICRDSSDYVFSDVPPCVFCCARQV